MDEQLKNLFEGLELSDDFKAKVTQMVESLLATQREQVEEETKAKYEDLSEQYAEYLAVEMESKAQQYIDEELMPKVEQYIDLATKEFVEENAPAIDAQAKVDLAEQMLKGMCGLAEAYNVTIPEGDDVNENSEKIAALEKRLDKQLAENKALQKQITDNKRVQIVDAVCADLTESQCERFHPAVDRISFHDEEQYKSAVVEMYESYFPSKVAESKPAKEEASKGTSQITESVEDAYLSQLFGALKSKPNK